MKNPLHQFEEVDTDFLVFSKTICGYCVAAKRLLEASNMSYTEFNLDDNLQLRSDLIEATGHRTVPIIFDLRTEVTFVGGFDELKSYL
tara:strand:- start:164 stop:427 length:264 start_codon:yes stop_codon:yes gene_type:complete